MNSRPSRPISRDDLLTIERAAIELGRARDVARVWLDTHKLIVIVPGIGERVVWGMVLDEIARIHATTAAAPTARKRLPRETR